MISGLQIQSANGTFAEAAQRRLDMLTKPQGSLGRLEEFARSLAAIAESTSPSLRRKAIFIFAGDHGVAAEGVSAFPKEVTRQMVFNFLSGGAGINVLGRHAGAEVIVVDIGVDYDFAAADKTLSGETGQGGVFVSKKVVSGTKNMRSGPAMTRQEAEKCLETGIGLAQEYADRGYGMFGTGEMGIGNTTPSSAIAAVLAGRPVPEVTGMGTGISSEAWKNKVAVIEDSLRINNPDPRDPLDILAKVGGAEIGGIAGLVLGAASRKIPVVIDGFIATAGALIAYSLEPRTKDYMFAAHASVERGHRAMLEKMGLRPILDLNLRLGEGTGAALAMPLIEAGLKIFTEMTTFGEAGVSDKS